jgi:hypothetical protein
MIAGHSPHGRLHNVPFLPSLKALMGHMGDALIAETFGVPEGHRAD